jgi:hypothetical protein
VKNIRVSTTHAKFWQFFLIIFVLSIGLGEILCWKISLDYNPLSDSGYKPAIDQYQRIQEYVAKNGPPDCILFGHSLVQTGIDPETFSQAFQLSSGQKIDCYNFGMDASTMSSTVPMAMIMVKMYKPSYVIIGIQVFSFIYMADSAHEAENRFHDYGWVRYSLGEFTLEGWATEKSALYRMLKKNAIWMFEEQSNLPASGSAKPKVHPEVPRKFSDAGYGPLSAYRDSSPLFQAPVTLNNAVFSIDSEDFAALEKMIQYTQENHFHLILVEMPINDPSMGYLNIDNQIRAYSRQHGIPFLSTDSLPVLPPTAYSDQAHLQISGSMLFSQWLGDQLGKAVMEGTLSDVNSPIWSPVMNNWPRPEYFSTFGLSDSSYEDYFRSLSGFAIVPHDAIVFNPGRKDLDTQFLQSLIGFDIDWNPGVTSQERNSLFHFITVLGQMHYQEDLHLQPEKASHLEQWRANPAPAFLDDLGIGYILCRVELADPAQKHCPSGMDENPHYRTLASWNFDPLYEKYILYQVVGIR